MRPRITVLCLHAGARRGTYVARRSPGQERAAAWVAGGEAVRATLFELAALQHAREQAAARRRRIGRRLVSALAPFGLHPDAVRRWIARMGKGRWVAEGHARGRAVPEPPVGRRIPAGDPALAGGFGAGWHGPEPEGRWSAAGEAELLLRSPAPGLVLVLGLRSLAPQTVTIGRDGRPGGTARIGPEGAEARLPLPESGPVCIGIAAERTLRPSDIFASAVRRALGVFLSSLALLQPGSGSEAGSASGGAKSGSSSGSSGGGGSP
ncbi:MAG: hypothetical protein N2Z67_09460 [Acetobacteraceae bacterium]|nr:hypothetical protein [Acetobacteraceae bacterium]